MCHAEAAQYDAKHRTPSQAGEYVRPMGVAAPLGVSPILTPYQLQRRIEAATCPDCGKRLFQGVALDGRSAGEVEARESGIFCQCPVQVHHYTRKNGDVVVFTYVRTTRTVSLTINGVLVDATDALPVPDVAGAKRLALAYEAQDGIAAQDARANDQPALYGRTAYRPMTDDEMAALDLEEQGDAPMTTDEAFRAYADREDMAL